MLGHKFAVPLRVSSTAALGSTLEDVATELSGLTASTEQDFLRLGERLQEIVNRAQEHRNHIAGLVHAITGKTGRNLSVTLEELLQWTGQTCRAGDAYGRFRELEPIVRAVRVPLHTLSNAVRALRCMGVVTRVESARLGSCASGFEALASEVAGLGESIDERARTILESEGAISELLLRTEAILAESASHQRDDISTMTAECAQGLEELRKKDGRLDELTRLTQDRYAAFAVEVGNIVAALQAHDSARQGIDHVVEALRYAGCGLARRSSNARHIIELQIAQLGRIRLAFLEALESIVGDLSRLAQTIADCARIARELLDGRTGSRESWVGQLEARFRNIASAVCELAQSRQVASQAAAEVRDACSRMTGFVAEIDLLGERVRRLALNAEIQAVHLAETGVVMEAVAEGIRGVSENASEGARAAGEALREIEKAAGGDHALTYAGTDVPTGEAADRADQIRSLAAELRSADAESAQILCGIADGAEALCKDISALCESITAGRIFDQVTSSCLDTLGAIAAAGSERKTMKLTEALAHTASQYTMEAERRAHNEFVGAPVSVNQMPTASEFGDNVELF